VRRWAGCIGGLLLLTSLAHSDAATCSHRGELDAPFCDANGDLVADMPAETSALRDPHTLIWAYAPIEDPAVYANLFKPFTRHLEKCLGRQIVYYPIQSTKGEIQAMRTGRLHFAGFSTGSTVEAVNRAGAVPFAAKGIGSDVRGYHVMAIVNAASPYTSLQDLKGKRVAHATPLSNSGHLAPLAYFPDEGLAPGKDYAPIMSGSHDRSILGVARGDYDMAAIASDVLDRMVERGMVDREAFRILYKSAKFPTSSFAHAHDLDPSLVEKMKACFFNYEFTDEMKAEFGGDERFLPIRYEQDWRSVREVIEKVSGAPPL